MGHYRIGERTDSNIRLDAVDGRACNICSLLASDSYSIWMYEDNQVPIRVLTMSFWALTTHPEIKSKLVTKPNGAVCVEFLSFNIPPQLLEHASTNPNPLNNNIFDDIKPLTNE
jgi:hypothetical protein